jgi:hypothetical protein
MCGTYRLKLIKINKRGKINLSYLDNYLNRIKERGNKELAASIHNTADDIGSNYLNTFDFVSHRIGLLFGNIQSGKTGQVFGIICRAADLGFQVFVMLTTDNVVLQQQTLQRVEMDLPEFCICGENDAKVFMDNQLVKPTIIVLKKNYRTLRLWRNVLKNSGFLMGNPLFIIDDEADASSLNTKINQGKQSSINRYIEEIRYDATSSIYLQVTGTPQAILLQTFSSKFRPYFTYYFKPGNGYLGGDYFFPKSGVSECVTFTDNLRNEEKVVTAWHLMVSAINSMRGIDTANCLVHPSVKQAVHENFAEIISFTLDYWENHPEELGNVIQQYVLQTKLTDSFATRDITRNAIKLLKDNKIKVLILNGETEINSKDYSSGYNFIVGGNSLGRGVTFPKLQTIWYTRTSKRPQADTMWQHSRMFGYDRERKLLRLFISRKLYKLFADINAINDSIVSQLGNTTNEINLLYPNGLNPTRKEVLDNNAVSLIPGGTNFYPWNPDNCNFEKLDSIMNKFEEKQSYYLVSLNFIKALLLHIKTEDDFKMEMMTSIIDAILVQSPAAKGVLIVRRNRSVTQGTGALLSPNDWKLGNSFTDKVVLTMYRVEGEGWRRSPIWVPNIKFPNNMCYYDIVEGEEDGR